MTGVCKCTVARLTCFGTQMYCPRSDSSCSAPGGFLKSFAFPRTAAMCQFQSYAPCCCKGKRNMVNTRYCRVRSHINAGRSSPMWLNPSGRFMCPSGYRRPRCVLHSKHPHTGVPVSVGVAAIGTCWLLVRAVIGCIVHLPLHNFATHPFTPTTQTQLHTQASSCEFTWARGRLYDRDTATVLYEACSEAPTATVAQVGHESPSRIIVSRCRACACLSIKGRMLALDHSQVLHRNVFACSQVPSGSQRLRHAPNLLGTPELCCSKPLIDTTHAHTHTCNRCAARSGCAMRPAPWRRWSCRSAAHSTCGCRVSTAKCFLPLLCLQAFRLQAAFTEQPQACNLSRLRHATVGPSPFYDVHAIPFSM